jgi:hypothetical protein
MQQEFFIYSRLHLHYDQSRDFPRFEENGRTIPAAAKWWLTADGRPILVTFVTANIDWRNEYVWPDAELIYQGNAVQTTNPFQDVD